MQSAYIILFLFTIILCVNGILRSSSELTNSCYGVPENDFGRSNNVKDTYGKSPKVILNVGDIAIDFTLPNSNGELVTLSDLLKEKAVVLIWGHYTCPAFQGLNSDTLFIGSSYSDEYDLIDSVGDTVTVVHLVGPEPHPLWPYANFDSGAIKMNLWSTITQPQTYDERVKESVTRIESLLHEDAILLVEYLDGVDGINNNVWCSYAHAARAAILINTDGVIIETQDWFSKESLKSAILEM